MSYQMLARCFQSFGQIHGKLTSELKILSLEKSSKFFRYLGILIRKYARAYMYLKRIGNSCPTSTLSLKVSLLLHMQLLTLHSSYSYRQIIQNLCCKRMLTEYMFSMTYMTCLYPRIEKGLSHSKEISESWYCTVKVASAERLSETHTCHSKYPLACSMYIHKRASRKQQRIEKETLARYEIIYINRVKIWKLSRSVVLKNSNSICLVLYSILFISLSLADECSPSVRDSLTSFVPNFEYISLTAGHSV